MEKESGSNNTLDKSTFFIYLIEIRKKDYLVIIVKLEVLRKKQSRAEFFFMKLFDVIY